MDYETIDLATTEDDLSTLLINTEPTVLDSCCAMCDDSCPVTEGECSLCRRFCLEPYRSEPDLFKGITILCCIFFSPVLLVLLAKIIYVSLGY